MGWARDVGGHRLPSKRPSQHSGCDKGVLVTVLWAGAYEGPWSRGREAASVVCRLIRLSGSLRAKTPQEADSIPGLAVSLIGFFPPCVGFYFKVITYLKIQKLWENKEGKFLSVWNFPEAGV